MAVQKKQSVIPPSQGPLSRRIIDGQRKGNGSERTPENGSYTKPNSQAKKAAASVNKSVLICNTASRELSRLEREQRARRYYQEQLEERRRKLLDQRLKEERRRQAVEEKRRQRLTEEKERCESAVRKTLEKSNRAQHNLGPSARGRKPAKNVSFHSMNTTTNTNSNTTPHKPQHPPGLVPQRPSASPSPNSRSLNLTQIKAARLHDANKKNSNRGSNIRSTPVYTSVKPAKVTQSRKASPSPDRAPRRSSSRHSITLQLELPSVLEEDVSVCSSALAPGNSRPVGTSAGGQKEKTRKENPTVTSSVHQRDTEIITRTAGETSPSQKPPHRAPLPPEVVSRPSAGTTDPEEASRLLAERRREARLQREREERDRLQQEEAERRSRAELEHRRAEERAQQQAEAQRLIEEKRRREEEEQRRAGEERAQAMREAALLQKQREEEEAKERAEAEKIKQEREMLAQKEEADRQRLEEIMRRTRRTDSPDTKSVPGRPSPSEAQPKENTEPAHNGTIEHVVKLPVGTKSSQLGLGNEEDAVPVVAFKERRSLRALAGLEEIQTHQRAGETSGRSPDLSQGRPDSDSCWLWPASLQEPSILRM
ncbi:hypothetical protein F2P81_003158 [Scophthalmus maximus]|uniref:Ensconsin-like n=1 Tax=Scophthalmus maximus TaxID=52904 RepID=A0A6A4TK35_SCOMX|nr:hypothetical protein F2P81_003158 [Scophthalmus maximus]